METRDHWTHVYDTKAPNEVSWYQDSPSLSLELIKAAGLAAGAGIIDVGGGTSYLVDELLKLGYERIGILDVSDAALGVVKTRLQHRAERVEWYAADVTRWHPPHVWDLWHDRAVFHFQVEESTRNGYLATLNRSVRPGGWAVIATFALDGPTRCSGLPVQRYGPDELSATLGKPWRLMDTRTELHQTPSGSTQSFGYYLFQRAKTS